MAASFLDDPLFLIFFAIGLAVAGILFMRKAGWIGGGKKEETYKPSETFETTINKDLEANMDIQGEGFGLFSPVKLFLGMKELGLIDKYYYGKGRFAKFKFNQDKKDYEIHKEEKDVLWDLCFIRLKGKSIFHHILGIGKKYIIVKAEDSKKNPLVYYDVRSKVMELPNDTHLRRYGNVWHNCKESIEFVNDISVKRLAEVTMTHMQCFPDKVILLNEDQLKRERIQRIYADIEAKKWEKRKNAEDTVIE